MLTIDDEPWEEWVAIGLFSAFALLAGIPKLLALDTMVQNLAELGYNATFTVLIGACWTAAGIGAWFTEWRRPATIGTWFIIAGAVGSHLTNGDAFPYPLLAPLLLTLIILWYEDFFTYLHPTDH
jgi:hypothetical protein